MHFDRFAGQYEQILDRSVALSGEDSAYFAEYKANYLGHVFPRPFPGKILEFGCGVGMLAARLKERLAAAQVDGFDVSQESIERVDPRLTSQGVFTSSPAGLTHDYDLIVMANVMHHIPPKHRQEVIFDLANRLLPGGTLATFEHNPLNPVTRWVVERCPFDGDAILLPPSEIRSYYADANLIEQRLDYIVFMPRVLSRLRFMEPWLAWLPMGAQYVLMGKKHV